MLVSRDSCPFLYYRPLWKRRRESYGLTSIVQVRVKNDFSGKTGTLADTGQHGLCNHLLQELQKNVELGTDRFSRDGAELLPTLFAFYVTSSMVATIEWSEGIINRCSGDTFNSCCAKAQSGRAKMNLRSVTTRGRFLPAILPTISKRRSY